MLATGTMEGLGLTGGAALARCRAPSVTMSLLLPFLRHGGRAGEGWMCAIGAVGAGRTPQRQPALQAWAQHRSCLQHLPLPGGFPLPFAGSGK